MKLENRVKKGIRGRLARDESGESSLVKTLAVGVGVAVAGLAATVPVYWGGDYVSHLLERCNNDYSPQVMYVKAQDKIISGNSINLTAEIYDEDANIKNVKYVIKTLKGIKGYMKPLDGKFDEQIEEVYAIIPGDRTDELQLGEEYTIAVTAEDKHYGKNSKEIKIQTEATDGEYNPTIYDTSALIATLVLVYGGLIWIGRSDYNKK